MRLNAQQQADIDIKNGSLAGGNMTLSGCRFIAWERRSDRSNKPDNLVERPDEFKMKKTIIFPASEEPLFEKYDYSHIIGHITRHTIKA
ncbi:hypothetical protein A7K91_15820 [Paenibacillus oryzae]|uniref:Uncharacterized protein n=1 Tax=Paenibacillus oryzae TaxID=1844972 RepID=A0A1A5YES7_9BACL|nr:hypothetical protein [Paenibacillus oryzae]OBR64089.1 hypothetical protein A7K91_15820 [Paenibacillus oryzae]